MQTMVGPRFVHDDGYRAVARNITLDQQRRLGNVQYVTADRLRTGDAIAVPDGTRFTLLSATATDDGRVRIKPMWGTAFIVPTKTRFARVLRRADTRPDP